MAEETLLTMDEAITRLSTTRGTFYRWLRAGKIKGMKVGRQWRFREEEVDRFLSGAEPSIELPVNPAPLVKQLEEAIGDAPEPGEAGANSVEHVVHLMLICGLKKGAMSLFIDAATGMAAGEGAFSLRMDGLVRQVANYDIRLHRPIVNRLKQMSGMDVTESRKPQDGRIQFPIKKDRAIDFVVNTMPSRFGESCALMVRDPLAGKMTLDLLGLAGANLQRTRDALARKQGLYVVSGPAESGKTVTAYSLLNGIDKSAKRIISIDEPGSITLDGVIQTAPETFDTGAADLIRSAARQNWDVLNIDYIQDASTLRLAMREALSGQVITTMHFKDAITGLLTIREWGAADLLLGEALVLITSQRLVRRLCEKCRQPLENLSDEDAEFARAVLAAHGSDSFEAEYLAPAGCADCSDGYLGRIALFETLTLTPSLDAALVEGADYQELRRIALDEGMESLCLDGVRKAAQGITSLREVRRVVPDLADTW